MSEQEVFAEQVVIRWIEREIGPVRSIARQGRWASPAASRHIYRPGKEME